MIPPIVRKQWAVSRRQWTRDGKRQQKNSCPEVNRRTLQRDLKKMVVGGLLLTEGETHNLLYRLRRKRH
jgi:hypothetical protein